MFKKEFYKFKELYLISLVIIGGFLLYFASFLHGALLHQGGVRINLGFLLDKRFEFFHLLEFNLIFSALVAMSVFMRERIHARLRLSLHFPNHVALNVGYIIFVGLLCVVIAYALEWGIFNLLAHFAYPREILVLLNLTLVQNFIFGAVLYLLVGALILESSFKRAILHFVITLACLYLYYEINPEIYALKSFYANELGFFYIGLMGIYATNALLIAFSHYLQGYIK